MIPEGLPGLIKSKEWHARRRKCIGSSDWAHILSPHNPGEYKWWCLRQLYYEKNAVPHDFPESVSAAAARGIFLEDKVLEMFKIDTGCRWATGKAKRAKYVAPGVLRPEFWVGQPDQRAIFPDESGVFPVEAKTMGIGPFLIYMDNGLSVGHQIQCQHHVGMQGSDMCWLVVGYFGDYLDYQPEPIVRDNEMIDLMVTVGTHFWDDIRTSSTPPDKLPLTKERCGDCPFRRTCLGIGYYEKHVCPIINVSDDADIYKLLLERVKIDEKVKGMKGEKDDINDRIKSLLETKHKDPEEAFCREFKISHKKTLKRNFNKNGLMADEPEIYRKYLDLTPSRTFAPKVTKKSQENWEAKNAE